MRSEVDYASWRQGYMVWGKDADGVDYEVSILFFDTPMMGGIYVPPPLWRVTETKKITIVTGEHHG